LFTAFLFIGIAVRLRFCHLRKLVSLNVIKRQQKRNAPCFYAAVILNEAIIGLFFHSYSNSAKQALFSLCGGRTEKAARYFRKKKPLLGLLLAAHGSNLTETYAKLLKRKTLLKNQRFLLFVSLIAHLLFDEANFRAFQRKINIRKLPSKLKSYAAYAAAVCYLNEADMLSASQQASLALNLFKKQGFVFEEAQTYLLFGEIYRISCVNDIAQTMIESAKKIYASYKLSLAQAKTEAALGMLMLFGNRFEEAEDKLNRALQLANHSLSSDIKNQLALLKIAQKQHDAALKLAGTSIRENRRSGNNRGQALGMQLRAHLFAVRGNYSKAENDARKAAKLYLEQQNISAYVECLYSEANALCRQQKYAKAEKLLRKILNTAHNYDVNFHIANAYSLLGLIYLWQNDLSRAKVLLQQSLHLEQRHERCPGLAADYADLALIEAQSGNSETAAEHLKIALEYAVKTEDKDLIALINKISPVSDK